jgi:phosphate/sulfate permease
MAFYMTVFIATDTGMTISTTKALGSSVDGLNPTQQYTLQESYLRVTIRHPIVESIPSCQYRITQIELQNLVRASFCLHRS